jgi:hypothetical protein
VIGATRYERSDTRTNRRNGFRDRLLATKAGQELDELAGTLSAGVGGRRRLSISDRRRQSRQQHLHEAPGRRSGPGHSCPQSRRTWYVRVNYLPAVDKASTGMSSLTREA